MADPITLGILGKLAAMLTGKAVGAAKAASMAKAAAGAKTAASAHAAHGAHAAHVAKAAHLAQAHGQQALSRGLHQAQDALTDVAKDAVKDEIKDRWGRSSSADQDKKGTRQA